MTSIIHKETAKVDKRQVAGFYLNGLKRNIFLQADPSVINALKESCGNYDVVVKRMHIKIWSLTPLRYIKVRRRVPLGLNTMPDISVIEAVLNIKHHNYIYIVASVENSGYHSFIKTAAQHSRHKEQYVQWINFQGINQ